MIVVARACDVCGGVDSVRDVFRFRACRREPCLRAALRLHARMLWLFPLVEVDLDDEGTPL